MSDKGLVVFQQGDIRVTQEEQETFVSFLTNQAPTEAELKLHYHFCASKGVHPLDRLIYFTKRSGKYTPITSIDYLRIRADSSREYAGSDDAVFKSEVKKGSKAYPGAATVTVWRLVNGQRCPFTATARWSEYAPANLDENAAFMWKSKPYVMLAKCAEALALRKGFPGQLQGLYIGEEYDASATQVSYPTNVSHSNGQSAEVIEGDTIIVEESEPEEATRMIDFFGKQKPADALIDLKNVKAFTEKFVGPELPIKSAAHLKNHLRQHFHVDMLSELTWEKFKALIDHVKSGVDDERWYTPEKAVDEKKPDAIGATVDLNELTKVWTEGKLTDFQTLESGLQERVKDMLALVDAEAIEPTDYKAMVEVLNA